LLAAPRGSCLGARKPRCSARPWTPLSPPWCRALTEDGSVYNRSVSESNWLLERRRDRLDRPPRPREARQQEVAGTAREHPPCDLQPRVRERVVDRHAAGDGRDRGDVE